MRTEGGLAQKGGHKLVSVHLVDASPHGAPTSVQAGALLELPACHSDRRGRRAMGHSRGLVCKGQIYAN